MKSIPSKKIVGERPMPAFLLTSVIISLHQPCLALAWLAFVVTESAELLSVSV